MDLFTPEKRWGVMSRIRGRDTKPELALRSILHRLGYRFTIQGPKTNPCPAGPSLFHSKINNQQSNILRPRLLLARP
jgi:G:T-mismatch repair DNA endonuclease (very short patch repair protein)